jgi:membrane protease YdiL (CAAX protease family)
MPPKTFLQKLIRLLLLFIGFNFIGSIVSLILINWVFNVDVSAVLNIIKNIDSLDYNSINTLKFMQFIQVIFSFILPAQIFAKSESQNQLAEYFEMKGAAWKHFFIAVLLVFSVSPLVSYIAELNAQIQFPGFLSGLENYFKLQQTQTEKLTEIFLRDNTGADLMLNLFIVGVLAAFAEELFFRGVLQKILIEKIKNVHLAIFICSLLFSALHQEFYTLIPRILLGMLLGYAYVFSKSIWVPMLIHFVNNASAVVLDSLYKQGYTSFNPNENEYFGAIGLIISLIVSISLFWYWNKVKELSVTSDYGERVG